MSPSECIDDTREKIIALEAIVKTWFTAHDKRSDDHWAGISTALNEIKSSMQTYVPREEMKASFENIGKSIDTRFAWLWRTFWGGLGLVGAGFWYLVNTQGRLR